MLCYLQCKKEIVLHSAGLNEQADLTELAFLTDRFRVGRTSRDYFGVEWGVRIFYAWLANELVLSEGLSRQIFSKEAMFRILPGILIMASCTVVLRSSFYG